MNEGKDTSGRLLSIDALRGYAMFFAMGGAEMLTAWANGTEKPFIIAGMKHLMTHAEWNGLPYCDSLFPMFVFISGLTFPFSVNKRERTGSTKPDLYLMIAKRCLSLILLGFVFNGLLSNLNFAEIRYYSVLGRIGLAWAIAALIFLNTKKTSVRIGWGCGILIVYWLVLAFFSAPDMPDAGSFTLEGNIAGYIDRSLFPGHLYNKYYDPEGLLSTASAAVTALSGMLTGQYLCSCKGKVSRKTMVVQMIMAGCVLIVIGLLWALILPINKRMWTSSFNCIVIGMAIVTFAVFFFVIDVKKKRWWTPPLIALGRNAIVAYVGFRIFGRFETASQFLFGGFISRLPDRYHEFGLLAGGITISWAIMLFLYRKKIIINV